MIWFEILSSSWLDKYAIKILLGSVTLEVRSMSPLSVYDFGGSCDVDKPLTIGIALFFIE